MNTIKLQLQKVPNAYNLIAEELRNKYWDGIRWHHDNPQCGKAVYQVELFSNGCISIGTLEKRLSKLCKAPLEEIEKLLSKYYEWV